MPPTRTQTKKPVEEDAVQDADEDEDEDGSDVGEDEYAHANEPLPRIALTMRQICSRGNLRSPLSKGA